MPINPGQAITSEQDRQNSLLRQFLQGNQQLSAGAQAQAGKDQAAASDLANAQQLHAQNPNASVEVGGTKIGGGFGVLKEGGNEARRVDKAYNDQVQPLHDQVNSMAMGVGGLLQGTGPGDELSAVIKARQAEGKGKLLAGVVTAFGVPKSAAGDIEGIANYIRGIPMSKMSPEQRAAIASLYEMQLDSLERQIGTKQSKFQQTAAQQAPIMSSSGQLEPYLAHYGNPSAQVIADSRKKLADFRAGKFTSAPSPEQQGSGPVDKLKQFLGFSPTAPQAAPVDPIGQAADSEIQRRKASKAQVPDGS